MKLITYTREPGDDRIYAPKLAYSCHLALKEGEDVTILNHNSGVLFAKATENADGSLKPKSMRRPMPFKLEDGLYGILSVRTEADGWNDKEDPALLMFHTTRDFIDYNFEGMYGVDGKCRKSPGKDKISERVIPAEAINEYRSFCRSAELVKIKTDEDSFIAITPASIDIPDELGAYLKKKLLPAKHVSTEYDKEVAMESFADLDRFRVSCRYSDGATVSRKVLWNKDDLSKVNFSEPGSYKLKGKVYQPHFAFPLIENRADPCVIRWQGKYYFVSTHDADHEHTMYARVADRLEDIVSAEDHMILDAYTYDDIGGLLWAPEFHEIDGKLYIFHAATPEPFFCEESHVMVLKEGGDPCKKEDWSRPRRIVKKDGSELAKAGETITLDMTVFEWEGSMYAAWSQRQFLPKDLGAWLYFARLNREEPWKLDSDPIVLSKPDFGWANNHTFVDEGPFALYSADKSRLFLTFSSAAVDSTYVVGMLTLNKGDDPLDIKNWKKKGYPLLTSRSAEGQFGTGHNAYVTDEDGIVYNTYHARPSLDGPRSTGIRRVHFDVDGEPMLDVTEDLDLNEKYADVEVTVRVN